MLPPLPTVDDAAGLISLTDSFGAAVEEEEESVEDDKLVVSFVLAVGGKLIGSSALTVELFG